MTHHSTAPASPRHASSLAPVGPLDWRRHRELLDSAYGYTRAEIAARGAKKPQV